MERVECPGLPASWLNGWLAAVGLLTLEPRLRLSWTSDPEPIAVITASDGTDPMTTAVDAWPSLDRIQAMPTAEHVEGADPMLRTVSVEVFQQRAELARQHVDSWTLSSTLTDLCVDVATSEDATVRSANLYSKRGPGSIGALHDRLLRSFSMVSEPSETVMATLGGYGARVKANGLGFDVTRISALADSSDTMVDPVIEVLAFFGLRLLPMRGEGIEVGKSAPRSRFAARQRNWSLDLKERRALRMTWPAWTQPLDSAGIDALLDIWSEANERRTRGEPTSRALSRLGVHAAWQTTSFVARTGKEPYDGFASKRLELGIPRR